MDLADHESYPENSVMSNEEVWPSSNDSGAERQKLYTQANEITKT